MGDRAEEPIFLLDVTGDLFRELALHDHDHEPSRRVGLVLGVRDPRATHVRFFVVALVDLLHRRVFRVEGKGRVEVAHGQGDVREQGVGAGLDGHRSFSCVFVLCDLAQGFCWSKSRTTSSQKSVVSRSDSTSMRSLWPWNRREKSPLAMLVSNKPAPYAIDPRSR